MEFTQLKNWPESVLWGFALFLWFYYITITNRKFISWNTNTKSLSIIRTGIINTIKPYFCIYLYTTEIHLEPPVRMVRLFWLIRQKVQTPSNFLAYLSVAIYQHLTVAIRKPWGICRKIQHRIFYAFMFYCNIEIKRIFLIS